MVYIVLKTLIEWAEHHYGCSVYIGKKQTPNSEPMQVAEIKDGEHIEKGLESIAKGEYLIITAERLPEKVCEHFALNESPESTLEIYSEVLLS